MQANQEDRTDRRVSIVIPTLCATKRAVELVRAIESVHRQVGVPPAQVIVVVNGRWFDPALVERVAGMACVKVFRIVEAGISVARLHGREQVDTPYFLMLDDDDELLPNALEQLLGTFEASDADTGVVVADAYNDLRQGNYGFFPSVEAIERDPLNTLLEQNWLIAQSALFRTALIPPRHFDIRTQSNECTMIAFNVAVDRIKVKVNENVLAIIHDKLDSESKMEHFATQETTVVQWMLTKKVPSDVRSKLRRKLAATFHNNSMYFLRHRRYREAVVAHIRSMLVRGGDPYFLYGRHILNAMLKR